MGFNEAKPLASHNIMCCQSYGFYTSESNFSQILAKINPLRSGTRCGVRGPKAVLGGPVLLCGSLCRNFQL